MSKIILVFVLMSFACGVMCGTVNEDTWAVGEKPAFCKKKDCPKYTVVSTFDDFEERQYAASTWITTTVVNRSYQTASFIAWFRLCRYTLGYNAAGQKIPGTTPVRIRVFFGPENTVEKKFTMAFFVPSALGVLPDPKDSNIVIKYQNKVSAYVRVFEGFTTQLSNLKDQAKALGESLKREGFTYRSTAFNVAKYDSPLTLFKRYNEVWYTKV